MTNYKPNLAYVEAMAGLLVLFMVPSKGHDDAVEYARHNIVHTHIFGGVDPDEAARILENHIALHRQDRITESLAKTWATSLPPPLQEKLFAIYARYVVSASDGNLGEPDFAYLGGMAELLNITNQTAGTIAEVFQILERKIL